MGFGRDGVLTAKEREQLASAGEAGILTGIISGGQQFIGQAAEFTLGKGVMETVQEKGIIAGAQEQFRGFTSEAFTGQVQEVTKGLGLGVGGISEAFGVSPQMLLIGAVIVGAIILLVILK